MKSILKEKKTRIIVANDRIYNIRIQGNKIDQVPYFKYLRTVKSQGENTQKNRRNNMKNEFFSDNELPSSQKK